MTAVGEERGTRGKKERLDRLLVARGLADTRSLAQALIMEGRVSVDGVRREKAGTMIPGEAVVEVAGPPRPYASRGGHKLAAALDAFGIDVEGLIVLDVGAGTGGFTDCLLQRGAARVLAVDVGHGQIDQKLRDDPRVAVLEKLNARMLQAGDLDGPADLAVMDVSFISATLILPRLPDVLRGRDVIVLVKPQFEVGRGEVGKGGVVRDPEGFRAALRSVIEGAAGAGFHARGIVPSPIRGAAGNQEFLLHLRREPREGGISDEEMIDRAVAAAAAPAAGEEGPS